MAQWLIDAAQWLTANPFWPLVGVMIGLIGLYYRFVGTRVRKPLYAIVHNKLVMDLQSDFPTVQMLHNGQPIPNLTATRLAFWNAGRETIRKADVVPAEPLHIVVTDPHTILECAIIQTVRPANEFEIVIAHDQRSVNITFEYVDRNEGCMVQVLHTATESSDVKFIGRVMGAGPPRRVSPGPPIIRSLLSGPRRARRRVTIVLFNWLFPAVILVLILIRDKPESPEEFAVWRRLIIITAVLQVGYFWIAAVLSWWRRIPEGLMGFFDQ